MTDASLTRSTERHSVMLLDGESPFAFNVVRCLSAVPGLRIHALTAASRMPFMLSTQVASVHRWRGVDASDAAQECGRVTRAVGARLCLAVDQPARAFLIRDRHRLPVPANPMPSRGSFDVATDKWKLACFLSAHGLPHPPTILCVRNPNGLAQIRSFVFPALIKPRAGGNGNGIRLFTEPGAVVAYLDERKAWGQVVLQHSVEGRDIDCSVYCLSGRILSHTIQRPFAKASEDFRASGAVEFIHDDRVLAVTAALMAALRWYGVAHVDLRMDETGQLSIIEVNPRFWGSVVGSLHAGVNFPWLAYLAGIGETPPRQDFRRCRYVSGSVAASHWLRGRIRPTVTGFTFGDTAFRYAARDPLPSLTELVWGRFGRRRRRATPCP